MYKLTKKDIEDLGSIVDSYNIEFKPIKLNSRIINESLSVGTDINNYYLWRAYKRIPNKLMLRLYDFFEDKNITLLQYLENNLINNTNEATVSFASQYLKRRKIKLSDNFYSDYIKKNNQLNNYNSQLNLFKLGASEDSLLTFLKKRMNQLENCKDFDLLYLFNQTTKSFIESNGFNSIMNELFPKDNILLSKPETYSQIYKINLSLLLKDRIKVFAIDNRFHSFLNYLKKELCFDYFFQRNGYSLIINIYSYDKNQFIKSNKIFSDILNEQLNYIIEKENLVILENSKINDLLKICKLKYNLNNNLTEKEKGKKNKL